MFYVLAFKYKNDQEKNGLRGKKTHKSKTKYLIM